MIKTSIDDFLVGYFVGRSGVILDKIFSDAGEELGKEAERYLLRRIIYLLEEAEKNSNS